MVLNNFSLGWNMKIAIIGLGLRAAQLFMALKTINPEATLDVYVDPSPNGIKTLAS